MTRSKKRSQPGRTRRTDAVAPSGVFWRGDATPAENAVVSIELDARSIFHLRLRCRHSVVGRCASKANASTGPLQPSCARTKRVGLCRCGVVVVRAYRARFRGRFQFTASLPKFVLRNDRLELDLAGYPARQRSSGHIVVDRRLDCNRTKPDWNRAGEGDGPTRSPWSDLRVGGVGGRTGYGPGLRRAV